MEVLLNPYDQTLSLATEEGLQLYIVTKKGLEKEERYTGSKEKHSKFVKLMGKAFKTFWMMDILKVHTEWKATKPANPNFFESNTMTIKKAHTHAELV